MGTFYPSGGFQAVNVTGQPVRTSIPIAVDPSAGVMALGQPVYIDYADGDGPVLKTAVAGTNKFSGVITRLIDDTGKSRNNKPTTKSGWMAEITTSPDQVFICACDDTGWTDANGGQYFDPTAEGATGSDNPLRGSPCSTCKCDASTLNATATDLLFQAIGRVPLYGNDAATAGTLITCRPNPTYFVPVA